jgi:hypothetical protein
VKRSDLALWVLGLIVVLGLVVAACGPAAAELATPPEQPQESAQRSGVDTPETPVQNTSEERASDPRVKALVDRAKSSLSDRLGVPVEQISLGSVEEVEWRDSSLGCPRSGSASLTVITPGFLIILVAEGEEYEYHTDKERVVTCDNPQAPYASESSADVETRLVAAAKADLARRLGMPAGDIATVGVEAKDWSDASLGCPEEGMMYAQVITQGYQITLSAGGSVYDYRTDLSSVRLCEQ